MKVETCSFSGFKIYPGHGSLYVSRDAKIVRFVSSKMKSLHLQRKKNAKFDWTIVFRKLHKKGQNEDMSKKRTKKTVKVARAYVGASLEVLKKKKDMTSAARAVERKAQIDKIKAEKKLKSASAAPKQKISKQAQKGFAPKVQGKSR